ncbi:MAG: YybS family protein [Geobacteraceae bacterium]
MNSAGYQMIGAVVKGSLLTFALFLLYSMIPFLGAFAGIFVPFPCIYYTLKYNRVAGYAIVLLMILSLAFLNQNSLLPYLILAGTCSLALPEFLMRGRVVAPALFLTVGLNTCLVAGLAVVAVMLFNINIDEQLRRIIQEAIAQVGETYRQSGLSGKELEGLNDGLKLLESSFVTLYPSFLVILLGVVAGLNLLLLKKVSASLGKKIHFESFTRYRNPDALIWLLIIAGFTLLADIPVLIRIALNVLFLVYFLYFVQGLALCGWIANKKNFPRVLQVLFYVLLAVQPLLTAIVAVFGLADLWAGFRSRKIKENL